MIGRYDTGMSVSRQSNEMERIPDTLEEMNAWEQAEEDRRMRSAIDYMLSMTPAERLQRHCDANRVIHRLEALAAKHGVRPMGWMVIGPDRGRKT
jgi:hypothetical protein